MRTIGLVLAMLALAAAHIIPEQHKIADKDFLLKQKQMFQLFVRVHQPNMYMDMKTIGDNYDIKANIDMYKDTKVVKTFLKMYEMGMLPRGEIFSVLYDPHMEQAIKLFDLFYYAKDWDTFMKTACWARDRVNEGQFVYALTVAVMHRDDTKDMAIPPMHEVMPHLFVDAETIQKVYEARMEYVGMNSNEVRTVVIPVNMSTVWKTMNPEQQLTYFTEDVGLNAYHTYFHLMYPFWLTAKNYGLDIERYGELFYYTQQQLLARYNLERITMGLPEVDILVFNKPIKTGYDSMIRYQNGMNMAARPDNMMVQEEEALYNIEMIKDIEMRIRQAIDLGYVITEDGSHISIYEFKGIDILGTLVESYGNSVNHRYYSSLFYQLKSLVSRMVDPIHKHDVAPGMLENFMTALRDPIYYRMCKRIDVLFQHYKKQLDSYIQDELAFPGVKIDKVEIDKLITYMDKFDIDMMNAINVYNLEEAEKLNIIARQQRLTYKPFTYKMYVKSDKEVNTMVRVFMGPKYDIDGVEMNLDTMRKYMVELDRFPYKVVSGQNVITRNSHDSYVIAKDVTTTKNLMYKIDEAIEGNKVIKVDEIKKYCGYPENLLLPKGTKTGTTYTLFVMVTPYDGPMTDLPMAYVTCGAGFNTRYPDTKPMGFPFDRTIKDYQFVTPNMIFKDVNIYHKKTGDLNIHL